MNSGRPEPINQIDVAIGALGVWASPVRVPGSIFAERACKGTQRYSGHLLVSSGMRRPHRSARKTSSLHVHLRESRGPRAGSLRRSTAFFNFRWPPRGRKWEDGLGAVLGSLGEVPGEGASSAPGPARPWPRPLHPPAPWSRGASESQCPASIVEPAGRANKAPVE